MVKVCAICGGKMSENRSLHAVEEHDYLAGTFSAKLIWLPEQPTQKAGDSGEMECMLCIRKCYEKSSIVPRCNKQSHLCEQELAGNGHVKNAFKIGLGSGVPPAVFSSLMDLVISFRNFKVRINAAVALSSPPLRKHYGQFFQPVWVSLLKALENSQNMEDFSEYKHRDHLVEQVCLALGHLTTLLEKDDLLQLEDTVQLYYDTFKSHVHRVLERLVPEKSTALFSASYTLCTLSKQTDLNLKQRNVVQCLTDVFVPEF